MSPLELHEQRVALAKRLCQAAGVEWPDAPQAELSEAAKDFISGKPRDFRDEIVARYCQSESMHMIEADNRRKNAESKLTNYIARHTELVRGVKVIAEEHKRSAIAGKLTRLLEDFT